MNAREREGDRGVRLAEFLPDRREGHDDEEEIERVEHPAEESGGDGGVLIAGGSGHRSLKITAFHARV